MNDTRYHRSQATVSTLNMVFYTPGGPERFVEFCYFCLGCSCSTLLIGTGVLRVRIRTGLDVGGGGVFSAMACLF